MVPGACGNGFRKRKAENQRHNAACKKIITPRNEFEAYFGNACCVEGGAGFGGDGRVVPNAGSPSNVSNIGTEEMCFIGEEPTDDESEFSSDGRASPSHPAASWIAAGGRQGNMMGFDVGAAGLQPGGAGVNWGGMAQQTSAGADSAGVGRMVGDSPIAAGYNPYYQQQYQQEQQQQQQQQQRDTGRHGGRTESDEWGWFVDAGEDQQAPRGNVHGWGVKRGAQD